MDQIFITNMAAVSDTINAMVRDLECTYIEACVLYCEERNIEIEHLASIIKKNQGIKAHIQAEGKSLNMLKKEK